MPISSTGIGSGLNVTELVTQLMAVERLPVAALDKKEASYQAKLSSLGTVKNAMAALQTAARAIATADKLTPVKSSIGDATLLAAAPGSGAAAGSYDVEVKSLAQSQKIRTSVGFTNATDVVGTGTVTFDFGSYDAAEPPVFTANAAKPAKSVTLTSSNNTLSGLRDAINASDMGVTASIINDGSKNILTFTSNDTGTKSALKVSVSDPSLNAFAYDPTGTGGTSSMDQIVAAQNAVIVVDSVEINQQSNKITDAIQGVTLNLTKADPGKPTKVTMARDNSGTQAALEGFIKAYNEANKAINDATAYNISTGVGAALNGDSTMRGVQNQMRALFSSAVAGAPKGMSVLADVGISFQRDGTLAMDTAKFAAASADPTKDVSKLFATSAGSKGYGYQMDVLLGRMLSPVGVLNGKATSINEQIKGLTEQRATLNSRLDVTEKRYRAQFSALDKAVSSMSSTSSFLTQQLALLANNS